MKLHSRRLARIKAEPACNGIPSDAHRQESGQDVRTGIHLGADDYMVKPFLPFELAERVHKLLHRPDRPPETRP